jgi:hypothetical protein
MLSFHPFFSSTFFQLPARTLAWRRATAQRVSVRRDSSGSDCIGGHMKIVQGDELDWIRGFVWSTSSFSR